MPFTTESEVRLKFQVDDLSIAPATLVLQSIDDAHAQILRYLDPAIDIDPVPVPLALGETLLAGAHLLRSLASRDAIYQKHITIGGQRIEPGKRFAALLALAAKTEAQAWRELAPYLAQKAGMEPASTTDTVSVL